jgi:hypothetical protein
MARHLSSKDIAAVVDILRGWTRDRLTWELLCDEVALVLQSRPARQTLYARTEIRSAYVARKKGLKDDKSSLPQPSSLTVAALRISRLEAENAELRNINSSLLEQFVVWQYNAYKFGVSDVQLNEELPTIDRERSEPQ